MSRAQAAVNGFASRLPLQSAGDKNGLNGFCLVEKKDLIEINGEDVWQDRGYTGQVCLNMCSVWTRINQDNHEDQANLRWIQDLCNT